jgi:hypothetical protein
MVAARAGDHQPASRELVLGVLADLDPPEAYLPEEAAEVPSGYGRLPVRLVPQPQRAISATPAGSPAPKPTVARWSGILGICALVSFLLIPVTWGLAVLAESEIVLFLGGFGTVLLMFATSIVAIVLAAHVRLRGGWAITGLVTGVLALLMSLLPAAYLLLALLA